MGWCSRPATYYKKGKVDRLAEIRSLYEHETSVQLLKAVLVGSTVYTAAERLDDDGFMQVFAEVSFNLR